MKISNSSTPPFREIAILCTNDGPLEHRAEIDTERLRDAEQGLDKQILSGLEEMLESPPSQFCNSKRQNRTG